MSILETISDEVIRYNRYGNTYRLTNDLVFHVGNILPRRLHPLQLRDLDIDEYIATGRVVLHMTRGHDVIVYLQDGKWKSDYSV